MRINTNIRSLLTSGEQRSATISPYINQPEPNKNAKRQSHKLHPFCHISFSPFPPTKYTRDISDKAILSFQVGTTVNVQFIDIAVLFVLCFRE